MSKLRPSYYVLDNGIECKDVTSEFCYNVGTAIAYLWRAGKKTEQGMQDEAKRIEDLEKAKKHIEFEVDRLKAIDSKRLHKEVEELKEKNECLGVEILNFK